MKTELAVKNLGSEPLHTSCDLYCIAAEDLPELIQRLKEVRSNFSGFPIKSVNTILKRNQADVGSSKVRLAVVAKSYDDLFKKIDRIISDYDQNSKLRKSIRGGVYFSDRIISGKIAFLYPGQGVQFPNMLLDLAEYTSVVEKWLSYLDSTYKGAAVVLPREAISAPTNLSDADYEKAKVNLIRSDSALGTLVATSLAFSEIMQSLGVIPDVVSGQSTGELTASIAAGVFPASSESDFAQLFRDLQKKLIELELSGQVPRGAGMAVSGLELEKVETIIKTLNSSVSLSLINCPNQMILYGSVNDIEEAFQSFKALGAICQILPFHQIFHNKSYESVGKALGKVLENFEVAPPKIPLYNAIDGKLYPDDSSEILKQATEQWYKQVNFPKTLEALYKDGVRFFVDVGPGSSLSGFIKDSLSGQESVVVCSASSERLSGREALLHCCANFYVMGKNVDLSMFDTSTIAPSLTRLATTTNTPSEEVPKATQTAFRTSWPFLGEIVEHTREHLLAKRKLTLEHDIFLKDHTLTRGLSQYRNDLMPLAVVPFTCSAEMISEAAVFLVHRYMDMPVVRSLENIRGHRWVSLDSGEVDVQIEAHLVPSSDSSEQRVKVKLFQESDSTISGKVLLFEGDVILSAHHLTAPEPAEFQIVDPLPPAFDEHLLYNDGIPDPRVDVFERYPGFFLGDNFRPIKKLLECDLRGIECELEVLPRNKFFAGISHPQFQIEPVLADAIGQIIGFAAREQLGRCYDLFPFQVEKIEQFGPLPAVGTRCIGRAKVQYHPLGSPHEVISPKLQILSKDGTVLDEAPLTEAHLLPTYPERNRVKLEPENISLSGEAEIIDENGRVILRASGWHDRPMSLNKRIGMARQYPQYELLSEELLVSENTTCRLMDCAKEKTWQESGGVWKRNMAHMSLVEPERVLWYSMEKDPDNQLNWLLTRIAIKDTARKWAQDYLGLRLSAVDMEVREISDKQYEVLSRISKKIDFPKVFVIKKGDVIVACCPNNRQPIGLSLDIIDNLVSDDILSELAIDAAKVVLGEASAETINPLYTHPETNSMLITNGKELLTSQLLITDNIAVAISEFNELEITTRC